MAKVEIYTTTICPFCDRAKALLQKKGVTYDEINVGGDPDLRQTMVERAGGRRPVPQIFINDVVAVTPSTPWRGRGVSTPC
jgi:glutaredoxin 3